MSKQRKLEFLKRVYDQVFSKKIFFTLVAKNQLIPITSPPFNWYCSGASAYFDLIPSNNQSYPQNWAVIYIDLIGENSHDLLPCLYVDTGKGYQSNQCINLPAPNKGKIVAVIRLPNNVQGLRFVPTEQAGNFYIGKITIREINKIELLIRSVLTLTIILIKNPLKIINKVNTVYSLWHQHGLDAVKDLINRKVQKNQPIQTVESINKWYHNTYRPKQKLLNKFRLEKPSDQSPTFSILMPIYNTPENWLSQAVKSVVEQTYSKWELICINDGSTLSYVQPLLEEFASHLKIKVIQLETYSGASKALNIGLQAVQGEYVCFLEDSDYLEPQALHRFAEAILNSNSDIIYSDEVQTNNDIDTITNVIVRPEFSYDYYISHPYFGHFIGIRTTLLQHGGFDETMKVSQDYDLILRLLEKAKTVSHVPDILYRWRLPNCNLEPQKQQEVVTNSIAAINRHMSRLGCKVQVKPGEANNFYDVNFEFNTPAKIAIIIPTKNREDLLKKCLDSLGKTVLPETADIYIIDHESDDPKAQLFLTEVANRHHVIPYKGVFNFSAIMNFGVKMVGNQYSHYLFLNNDIEAIETGWLEHMQALAKRREVGIVGAMLLYPDQKIQHAGVIVGLYGVAEHAHKFDKFYTENNQRYAGFNGTLLANRDFSAVTAACLLMRADVFNQIGGFDEKLAVGFGDVDLCLRSRAAGYKVLMDAHAVLIHYESASRGKTPHEEDNHLFTTRYHHLIANSSDPCFSPLLSPQSSQFQLNLFSKCPEKIAPRTVTVVLPQPHI